jgi:hypothetical protein
VINGKLSLSQVIKPIQHTKVDIIGRAEVRFGKDLLGGVDDAERFNSAIPCPR